MKFAIITVLALSALSQLGQAQTQNPAMLDQAIAKVHLDVVGGTGITAQNCTAYINNWMQKIAKADPRKLLPTGKEAQQAFIPRAKELRQMLFQTRVSLHDKFHAFPKSDKLKCETQMRKANIYLRTIEELFGEWLLDRGALPEIADDDLRGFDLRWSLTNPKFEGWKFQAGDVILDRGDSFLSAMIARLSDVENLFSHLAIVGQDSQGRLHVVESDIDDNLKVTPLAKWLKISPDARLALYRPKSAEAGKRAARFIYDKGMDHVSGRKKIDYDFNMNDRERESLFCSELVQWAYQETSGGKVRIPEFKSKAHRFAVRDYAMMRKMEIYEKEFFVPSDIDLDSRFELVTEYRNFPTLRSLRMQDAIMSSIFEWMVERNYDFNPDPSSWLKMRLAIGARKLFPQLPIPEKIPAGAAEISDRMEKLGDAIAAVIDPIEEAYYDKHKVPMTYFQIKAEADKLRRQDCARYSTYRREESDRQMEGQPRTVHADEIIFHLNYGPQSLVCD